MQITVDVPKETQELVDALVNIVENAKVALADGWQPGQDIPVILMGSIGAIREGIEGMDKMPAEAKADIAGLFIKKP